MRNVFVFSLISILLYSCSRLKKIPQLDIATKNQFESTNEYSSLENIYGENWDSIKNYDDIHLLPDFIQQNITKTFEISLTEFKENLTFDKAYENNFDQLKLDTSIFRYSVISKTIYPKYIVNYHLIDSTTFDYEYSMYSLTLSFDSFGQLLEINWPRAGFSHKEKFSKKETVRQIAKKYARRHFFIYKKVSTVELEYNHTLNKFIWKVALYQGKKTFNSTFRKYKVIIVDPSNLTILKSYTNYEPIKKIICSATSF